MKNESLYAVIDLGSHTIKMIIGEYNKKKEKIKIIENLVVPIAIGNDTFNKGIISNSTIEEIISIFNNFLEVINSYKIDNYYAVATSSLREAGNSEVLIERVMKSTGIKIEIIENIEETEILYTGIKRILKNHSEFKKKNIIIFSISAGSTQIILQKKGNILFSETHHLGTLKIVKDINYSISSLMYSIRPYSLTYNYMLKRFPDVKKINYFVAINDDIQNILKKEFIKYFDNDMFKIPKEIFNSYCTKLENMNYEKIKEIFNIQDNILKTTITAFFMVNMFFNLSKSKYLVVPEINFTLSYLYYIIKKKNKHFITKETKEDIISSAKALGRKYQYDEEHALQVSFLALKIFDSLKENFNFTDKERLYLEVACILHDIGTFISPTSHNKHSADLIRSSEILGLQNEEMNIIALIARYHRKSAPKPSHIEYTSLPLESRLMVSRLSAIIRIADALDNLHMNIVKDIRIELTNEKCKLILRLKENKQEYIELIKTSVKKKSDLFENFFGLNIEIEREI